MKIHERFQHLLPLLLALTACDSTPETSDAEPTTGGKADDAARFSAYDETPRWCGEVDGACLRRLGDLTPLNVDFASGEARDQGVIASCASHSFIGMLETQLAVERGITVDLSERYQLYANFMETGNMGDQPEVIVTFPEIVAQFGVLPESAYPYDAVMRNADRFSRDLAQGLEQGGETIDAAVAETAANSLQRFELLTGDDAIGALPDVGGFPVTLPVLAELAEGAIVPELETRDADGRLRLVPCFAESRGDQTFDVTPREYLEACFDHEPSDFYSCNAEFPSSEEQEDDCATLVANVDAWEGALFDRLDTLATVLRSLDEHEAVFVGVDTPLQLPNKTAALWTTRTYLGSGHAVTAVGYITAEDLADPEEQRTGMLASPSMFDAFAASVEPEYVIRLEEAVANGDTQQLVELRTGSAFGQQVLDEGGMLLFRNSWGTQLDDTEIGVEGFQSMTFAYFLSRLVLVQSRDRLGTEACGVCPGHTDPFFARFGERAREVAWNTVKARVLSSFAQAGEDPTPILEAFETCRGQSE